MTTQGPFWLVYLTSPGTVGSVSLMLLVRSSEFADLSESQQFSLSATFHFCESIGTTHGTPPPRLCFFFVRQTVRTPSGFDRTKVWCKEGSGLGRAQSLYPLLSWHLDTALADVLPFRPQLPSQLELPWL